MTTTQKKVYSIPVNWEVWDKVQVVASSLEDAIQYVKDNIEILPLGDEPEFIDGTYHIEDGEDGYATIQETAKYLNRYWSLSEGISGEELIKNYPYENISLSNKEIQLIDTLLESSGIDTYLSFEFENNYYFIDYDNDEQRLTMREGLEILIEADAARLAKEMDDITSDEYEIIKNLYRLYGLNETN